MTDRESLIQEIMSERNVDRKKAEEIADFMIGEMSDLQGRKPANPDETMKRLEGNNNE